MKVGDKVTKKIDWINVSRTGPAWAKTTRKEARSEATGTVVYVHPRGRFYTVEFCFPFGSFRESYIV